MKSWRNLPPALKAFFVVETLSVVVYVIYQMSQTWPIEVPRIALIDDGLYFATCILGIIGFVELARRSAGRVAVGFKITAVGFGVAVAVTMWWHVFVVIQPHWSIETMQRIEDWMRFVPRLLPLLGVVVAATFSQRGAAVVGMIALLVTDPAPTLGRPMYGWMASTVRGQMLLIEARHLIELGALFFIVSRIATAGVALPARDGTSGLRTIASGLWLRVVAACSVAGLTLLLVVGKANDGAVGIYKLATISSAIVGAISLAMIARGAYGAMVAEIPAAPLVVAKAAALWCLGVTLAQLPYTYRMLYGGADNYAYESGPREYVEALSVVAPIVAIAAIAAVARAISDFAARRGLEQLRFEAQNKGIAFVVLMLASLGLQQWLLPRATSDGELTGMMLGAAVCSLWGTVLIARLCALAADSLQAEPGLPTATLQP